MTQPNPKGVEAGPSEQTAEDENIHQLVRETRSGFDCSCGRHFDNEAAYALHIEVNYGVDTQ